MSREYNIDLLRVICCFAVVVGHCVLAPIHSSTQFIHDSRLINLYHFTIFLRCSVPVFFMITGYCIAKKDSCDYSYCLIKVKRFIATLFSIGLFYALLELFFYEKTLNILILGRALRNVISGQLWDHMWFVYSIIGIYLVLPVVHGYLQRDQHGFVIFTILLFVFTIIAPYIERWINIGIHLPIGGLLFYVCFGCASAKYSYNKKWNKVCLCIVLLSMIYMIVFADSEVWDNELHPAVCLQAVSYFSLFRGIRVKTNGLLLALSGCTWGVYLIHPLFVNFGIKALHLNLLGSMPYLRIVTFTILITAISFISTYLLKKIPVINQLL